jgi:predicted MFS family arabinose efflux permease
MDKRLLSLAVGTFAIGTDCLVVAGILPDVSHSLHVSAGTAGQLMTVYAFSYALCSPLVAALLARWSRKRLLLTGLAVLIVANVASALLPSFAFLLAGRALAGLAAAMFTPTASATAAVLVEPEERGRALAIVIAGLCAATALGAPIGTIVGGLGSWRGTMWLVALLGALAALIIGLVFPNLPATPRVGLRSRLAPLTDRRVALTLLTTFCVFGGFYTVYTFTSVGFDRATGGSASVLAALIFVWGVAGTVGNFAAGSMIDRYGSRRVIDVAAALAALNFFLLPWSTAHLGMALVAMVVWGICGWGLVAPQQHRLVEILPGSAPLLIALNSSVLYAGVSLSGVVGAAGIRAVGPHMLGPIGGALVLGGLVAAELARAAIDRSKMAPADDAHRNGGRSSTERAA